MILTTFLTNLSVFLFFSIFYQILCVCLFFLLHVSFIFYVQNKKVKFAMLEIFIIIIFFQVFYEKKKSFFLFYYFIHLYFRTDFFDLRRLWKRQENYIDNNKHETNYLTRVPISQFFLTNNGREYTFPFLHSFGKTKKH